jgi:hypothetical protein
MDVPSERTQNWSNLARVSLSTIIDPQEENHKWSNKVKSKKGRAATMAAL